MPYLRNEVPQLELAKLYFPKFTLQHWVLSNSFEEWTASETVPHQKDFFAAGTYQF